MLIPMDVLSFSATRTDSGTGVRAAPRDGPRKPDASFENVFAKELDRHDRKLLDRNKDPGGNEEKVNFVGTAEKPEPASIKNKEEPIDDNGEALAAGVMGELEQEVVFILEGEESVATPQLRVEDTVPQQQEQEPLPNVNQVPAEPVTDTEEAQNETVRPDSQQSVQHADEPETAEFKEILAAKTETVSQENKETGTGEVTARMPEVKSEDTSNDNSKGQPDANLKDNGNPSPLENENENSSQVGRDEQTQFKAAIAEKKNPDNEAKPGETTTATETIATPPPINETIKPEQLRGAAQMTQAAENIPVKPENLFEEMIQRVQTVQENSRQTMTIQLNPEFLGKVALEVALDAAGLHVKINAEDSGVRGMISSQLTTLIESLESKGIAVSEVDVVYAGTGFETFSEPNSGKQGFGAKGQNAARHTPVTTKKAGIEHYNNVSHVMDYYRDAGVSSVEFTA